MCAYKLVKCEFKWFGLQGIVEDKVMKVGVVYCTKGTSIIATITGRAQSVHKLP